MYGTKKTVNNHHNRADIKIPKGKPLILTFISTPHRSPFLHTPPLAEDCCGNTTMKWQLPFWGLQILVLQPAFSCHSTPAHTALLCLRFYGTISLSIWQVGALDTLDLHSQRTRDMLTQLSTPAYSAVQVVCCNMCSCAKYYINAHKL